MNLKDEILTELRQVAPRLALLEKTNPYPVPESYFVNFKSILLEKIKLQEAKAELKVVAPELSKLEINVVANIPSTYFSNFSERLLGKIRAEEALNELKEIAPELAKLDKVNVFEVPVDYFSALPGSILNKAIQQQETVAMAPPKWAQWLNEILERAVGKLFKPKYTFAFAGMATMLIIAVMMFMKANNTCNDLDCKFAQLSTEEINAYLDNKSDAYSDEIFEMNLDEKTLPAMGKDSTFNIYKDALKDVDDAALNKAITD